MGRDAVAGIFGLFLADGFARGGAGAAAAGGTGGRNSFSCRISKSSSMMELGEEMEAGEMVALTPNACACGCRGSSWTVELSEQVSENGLAVLVSVLASCF